MIQVKILIDLTISTNMHVMDIYEYKQYNMYFGIYLIRTTVYKLNLPWFECNMTTIKSHIYLLLILKVMYISYIYYKCHS